jgi:Tfp pilus assembly protein FimT
MAELVIVVAVVGIVTAFAVVRVRTSRSAMRVQNSIRQLASYMEKARIDAVRRHGNTSVTFTDTRTYSVWMDFNNFQLAWPHLDIGNFMRDDFLSQRLTGEWIKRRRIRIWRRNSRKSTTFTTKCCLQ